MADQNLIEKKKAEPGSMKAFEIGDFPSFVSSIISSLVTLLALSYLGSTLFVMCDPNTNLKQLFPTDLNAAPYKFPANAPVTEDLLDKIANNETQNLGSDMMEYLYPMKHPSYPYYSFFIPLKYTPSCQDTVTFILAKWYALTIAGCFSKWRSFYTAVALMGRFMLGTKSTFIDLFLFYVFPYVIFYMTILPITPFVIFFAAVYSSIVNNIPGGFAFTFSHIFGFVFGIANLCKTGIFSIYSWGLLYFVTIAGIMMMFVNIAWWMIVGGTVWLYSIAFLFICPLYINDGFNKMLQHFKAHRLSLLMITLIIVLRASTTYMSTTFTAGIVVGALYSFYKILKSSCPASPAAPAGAQKT
jgi:hypothetical protein